MFPRFLIILLLSQWVDTCAFKLVAQAAGNSASATAKQVGSRLAPLFDDDAILQFKLTGKLTALFNDRNDKMAYHPMLLQYRLKDSTLVAIQLKVETRGNFRRKRENCSMPPLMLIFQNRKK